MVRSAKRVSNHEAAGAVPHSEFATVPDQQRTACALRGIRDR
jgi:hypothetical protein